MQDLRFASPFKSGVDTVNCKIREFVGERVLRKSIPRLKVLWCKERKVEKLYKKSLKKIPDRRSRFWNTLPHIITCEKRDQLEEVRVPKSKVERPLLRLQTWTSVGNYHQESPRVIRTYVTVIQLIVYYKINSHTEKGNLTVKGLRSLIHCPCLITSYQYIYRLTKKVKDLGQSIRCHVGWLCFE